MSDEEDIQCYIDFVGDEILMNVLSKLTPFDLFDVGRVCTRWQGLLSEQLVWKQAELVFERNKSPEYLERFVNALNVSLRLCHLDISAVSYDFDAEKNILPIARIVKAGSNLHRNLKLRSFSFAYNIPDIASILELNRETLTSLSIEDFYCQQATGTANMPYRVAHDSLIDSVLEKMRSLPNVRELNYDFGECWKYLISDDLRRSSVCRVMDHIRSMPQLRELTLLNLVWEPQLSLSTKLQPITLDSLCIYESYLQDEAVAFLLMSLKNTLKKLSNPEKTVNAGATLPRALEQCKSLEEAVLPTLKLALSLSSTASKLSNLYITGRSEEQLNVSAILESPIFPRLESLSLLDGDWDDSVRGALVRCSKNLKNLYLREYTNSILICFGEELPPPKRLGSPGNPVVLLELLNGSCPKLEILDIDLLRDWCDRSDQIPPDWIEPLKRLKDARPKLTII